MAGFAYMWEFLVAAGREPEFEKHYGPDGTWSALFRQAPGYLGTLLLKDPRIPHRYVTIDRWESEGSYRAFRQRFALDYAELDSQCETLTTGEQALGEFDELPS